MTPLGPYNHVAKAGAMIAIGAVAGVDPATGELVGPDAYSQSRQIIEAFKVMLAAAGSDLGGVLHVQIHLINMANFEEMNRAYAETMGPHRPARTTIGVASLPKPGAVVTMSLTAVVSNTKG
jgi:2-iminobutanoate/2-iminopropanoate deaminase